MKVVGFIKLILILPFLLLMLVGLTLTLVAYVPIYVLADGK